MRKYFLLYYKKINPTKTNYYVINLHRMHIVFSDNIEQLINSSKALDILSQKKEKRLPYAYPCDNYLDNVLSNAIVRKALQNFVDKKCKNQIVNIKQFGQLVTESKFPRLNNILQYCYTELNVKELPEVYVTNNLTGINALSIGNDNNPLIIISQKAVVALSEGELKFMLGHEMGHLLQRNLECHTLKGILDNVNNKTEVLGPAISDMIEVPLNQWYRCAEYTADRAGLICCKDIDVVNRLFNKFCKDINDVSVTDSYMELSHSHPLLANRFRELCSYYEKNFNAKDRCNILNTSY